MSKERELLKKILATRWLDHALSCEVEKLLAQPEQTEQEPVAKITSIHTDGENLPVVITAIVLSEAVNIWDLPIKNNDLLYLAPPNREPVALAGTAKVCCLITL